MPVVGNVTASLIVAAATAIVLHHFAEWARMPERPREAGKDKFVVEPAPRGALGGVAAEVAARKRELRLRLREGNDGPLSGALGGGGGGGGAAGGDEEGEQEEQEEQEEDKEDEVVEGSEGCVIAGAAEAPR